MKIFMSGATGFVGRHLILRLLRDGHEDTVWARNPSKAALTLGGEVKVIGGADAFNYTKMLLMALMQSSISRERQSPEGVGQENVSNLSATAAYIPPKHS